MTTKKSENITNIEASPISALDKKKGEKRIVIDKVALATTDIDASDIILLGPIPYSAVVTEIAVKNDDLDSNGSPTLTVDVGLYDADGNVLVADVFAADSTVLQAANTSWTSVRNESGDITNITSEVTSLAGLTSNPGGLCYVGLTVTNAAATAAAGDLVVKVEYIN